MPHKPRQRAHSAPEPSIHSVASRAGDAALKALEQVTNFGPVTHLPVWQNITPAVIVPGVRALLEKTSAAFSDLECRQAESWTELMVPLEQLHTRLARAISAIHHLTSVKYSDELQAAYDAVRPEYIALASHMDQSQAIYQGLTRLSNGARWAELSATQQRIVTESMHAMERAGVHLEGEPRQRFKAIQEQLSKLSNDFQTHLVREEQTSRIKITDPAQVLGVPSPVLTTAAATAQQDGIEQATRASGPWHFNVNGVNYLAVMEHAESRSLREAFYRAFRARGTCNDFDNRPLLQEMLRLRQEMAQLVGFDNYAELSIDSKMAPTTAAVWQLMNELETAARPSAEREYASLIEYMAAQGAVESSDPKPWDMAYWSEKLKQSLYSYDSEALRSYFQMPRVMDGLFALIQKLYAVSIVPLASPEIPIWDDNVSFYLVKKDAEIIAAFYVDPYARPGEKRGGAWMNTAVERSKVLAAAGQTSSIPVALFVLNARPPAEGQPALMSLDEVRTLFHEFGHATQHMFTTVEEGGASGLNLVQWDAVELASQFNEFWMDYKPFLKNLTAHVDSGEALDDTTLQRIIDSRNFMIGNATLRQLLFAKTDISLHQSYGLPGHPDTTTPFEIEAAVAATTLVLPRLPDESQLPAFGHLFGGGYAAGYYSYKWAEVLAADAFAAFKEVGLENDSGIREVAMRFKDTVLGLGGSLPAAEVYRLFRGRDASTEALLADQGLA